MGEIKSRAVKRLLPHLPMQKVIADCQGGTSPPPARAVVETSCKKHVVFPCLFIEKNKGIPKIMGFETIRSTETKTLLFFPFLKIRAGREHNCLPTLTMFHEIWIVSRVENVTYVFFFKDASRVHIEILFLLIPS